MTLDEIIVVLADIKKYTDRRDMTETMRKLADFVENHLDDAYATLVEIQESARANKLDFKEELVCH